MKRRQHLSAVADSTRAVDGVAVIASFQSYPPTGRPYRLRARSDTAKVTRYITVALNADEARKLVADWLSMGLYGRHGRIESTP